MWFAVWFKGGDERWPHRETMGIEAENETAARNEAMRKMTEDFGIRYPEIYSIEPMHQSDV